ncbi:hypothetical protein B4U80_12511, partial [Leptotrombidium deliense]
MRTQTFFGCPQSFCYDHEVDDFVVDTSGNKPIVILFRGLYYWRLLTKHGDIPLSLPLVANAKVIGKDDEPWPGLQGLRYIDAAEAFTIDGKQVVLIFKDRRIYTVVDGETAETKVKTLFADKFDHSVDSVWYNRVEKLLFLFTANRFQTYSVSLTEDGNISCSLVGHSLRGIFNEFAGLPQHISAILSNLEDKTYFLKNMWYYVIPEKGWNVGDEKIKPKITFDP